MRIIINYEKFLSLYDVNLAKNDNSILVLACATRPWLPSASFIPAVGEYCSTLFKLLIFFKSPNNSKYVR